MIDKQIIDRLIVELQQVAAAYDEMDAVVTRHAKTKIEHETAARELAQFQRAFSDLQRQYQDERQQLGRVSTDLARRSAELDRINRGIEQAKQRAFGG